MKKIKTLSQKLALLLLTITTSLWIVALSIGVMSLIAGVCYLLVLPFLKSSTLTENSDTLLYISYLLYATLGIYAYKIWKKMK